MVSRIQLVQILFYMVTAPAFPEVTTFGRSQPEACANGLNAI